MGRAWFDASEAAKRTFVEADEALGDSLGAHLSEICFNGPEQTLNRTDVAQPALYVCGIASWRAIVEQQVDDPLEIAAAAGLSLGEYTALHLAGAFDFIEGLHLVATRGRLMQEAAEASEGSMVALIGGDEKQAQAVCDEAASGEVLVCANFNAPGQIVLSGHLGACERSLATAAAMGFRATALAVAGAFHSPLMQAAADGMAQALETADLTPPGVPVWCNVTASPHAQGNLELLRQRLVEQIISPVRWSESCHELTSAGTMSGLAYHELAPGAVLRGLMRRINRDVKVLNHDQP